MLDSAENELNFAQTDFHIAVFKRGFPGKCAQGQFEPFSRSVKIAQDIDRLVENAGDPKDSLGLLRQKPSALLASVKRAKRYPCHTSKFEVREANRLVELFKACQGKPLFQGCKDIGGSRRSDSGRSAKKTTLTPIRRGLILRLENPPKKDSEKKPEVECCQKTGESRTTRDHMTLKSA